MHDSNEATCNPKFFDADSTHAPFFGYNGEEQNPFTGLQYLRARYYAPQNGGFLTQDSFAGILTNDLSQNRYAYALNNPVNYTDPSGNVPAWMRDKNGNPLRRDPFTTKPDIATGGGTRSSTSRSSSKPTYTSPGTRGSMASTSHSSSSWRDNPLVRQMVTSPTLADSLTTRREQYKENCLTSSRPAANTVMSMLNDPYLSIDVTGLTPDVIQDFTESARAFVRRTCNSQAQHYTAQLESQQAVDQAMLNILGDAINGISDWWSRNGSTLMRGAMTTLIGVGTVAAAGAVAPIAAMFGAGVLIVAGGVAILGVTDIVLGAVDMTAAIKDDADLRAFVSSPGYTAVEGGATLFSMAGSAALQPYIAFAELWAKAAQANAAEAMGGTQPVGNSVPDTGVCFVAGTLVAAQTGEKPIEKIECGDEVLCADPQTGEYTYRTVARTFVNQTEELTTVTVNGEQITGTPTHPYYVEGKGWVEASALHEGQTVWLADGTKATVEAISSYTLQEPVTVYNFEVEDFHTYFVGDCGVLVHNVCNGTYGSQGGHHPLSKKAFEGNPSYSDQNALTISNDLLKQYGANHSAITGRQHTLYSEFAKTGQPFTLEAMQNIETQALIQAGFPEPLAQIAVQEAIEQLHAWGVTSPSQIPWN